jgi:hypothetical protein
MRIGIELTSNNSGKTFIRFSSGDRNNLTIRFPGVPFISTFFVAAVNFGDPSDC